MTRRKALNSGYWIIYYAQVDFHYSSAVPSPLTERTLAKMGCRGLWNLHINQKWYRLCHPQGWISRPNDDMTLREIEQLRDKPDGLEGWELVPFPSPIRSNLNYVYTVDRDAGTLIISLWGVCDGLLTPIVMRIDLARIDASSKLLIRHSREKARYTFDHNHCGTNLIPNQSLVSGTLDMDFGIPTPMNELQERFFTDLVFGWRFYIDDPLTWRYSSPVFRVLCIAFLRLAAWDFELSSDCNVANVELPINFKSIPSWDYPEADIFWFHGFLIVLQEDIETDGMISRALLKAKAFIDDSLKRHDVRFILISPRHIAFVEHANDATLASKSLSLLTNRSADQCSPGFRALSRILTSDCWKKPQAHRERWQWYLPPEILQKILHELEPQDAIAFSQASFVAEQCYYASVSQFKNVVVQSFESSIPCCGERGGLKEHGVRCSECCSWLHSRCVGLESWSSDEYVCMGCREIIDSAALDPGGINRFSCLKRRGACHAKVGGSEKSLQLRLLKPIPPCLIDYTILFNNSFSGLAYGLEARS